MVRRFDQIKANIAEIQPQIAKPLKCPRNVFLAKSSRRQWIKGETLRSLRTNSVKETVELRKLELLTRLLEQGYPGELAGNILAKIKFSSRNKAIQNKTKTSKKNPKHPEMFCLSLQLRTKLGLN